MYSVEREKECDLFIVTNSKQQFSDKYNKLQQKQYRTTLKLPHIFVLITHCVAYMKYTVLYYVYTYVPSHWIHIYIYNQFYRRIYCFSFLSQHDVSIGIDLYQ